MRAENMRVRTGIHIKVLGKLSKKMKNQMIIHNFRMWPPKFLLIFLAVGVTLWTGTFLYVAPLYLLINLPVCALANDKSVTFKSRRQVCECGSGLKESGRKASITLYTRHGVVLDALHFEKRCRNCGRGYFYSFHSMVSNFFCIKVTIINLIIFQGNCLYYDDTCLEQPYLITSRKTGFAIDLLYEWSLSIIHHSSRYVIFFKNNYIY